MGRGFISKHSLGSLINVLQTGEGRRFIFIFLEGKNYSRSFRLVDSYLLRNTRSA